MRHLLENIGKEAHLTIEYNFKVLVRIVDVRQAFGRTDYQISPIGGSGAKWVCSTSLNILGHTIKEAV